MKRVFSAILKDLWVLIFDLVAVNLSYYLAILIRFYVHSEFSPDTSQYVTAFLQFAPWYSIIAIVVFIAFRLYGGMWRYAGLNDMNRIILGSLTASVLHIIGTLLFIKRMPITYYAIGAVLQLIMVLVIRFAYKIFLDEKKRIARGDRIPVLVVGSGDLGQRIVRHLEENTPYKINCIVSSAAAGRNMDGIPVVGMDEMKQAMKRVKAVFIADETLTDAELEQIRSAADNLEVQDFTGVFRNISGAISVTALFTLINTAVTVEIDGQEKKYENGHKALEALRERYDVVSISADKVKLKKASDVTDMKWAGGEDISFF